MAYDKHTWISGETITATELNDMESGIENNSERLDELTATVNKNTTDIDSKLDKSSVTTSLTSTSDTDALAASAGKTLNDALAATTSKADNAQERLATNKSTNLKLTTRDSGFRIVRWDPESANIPFSGSYGVCAQFDFSDGVNMWYNNLAFSTTGKIYYSFKTNTIAWSSWVDMTNAMQIYSDANKAVNAVAYEQSLNKFTFRDAKTGTWHQITIN